MRAFGALFLCLGVAGCPASHGSAPSGGVRVVTALVRRGPVDDVIEATGEVQQPEEARLGAEISGTVALAPGRVGTVVHKGDVLVIFDDRPFQIALATAKARLAQSQATLETRRVQQQRVALRSKGVLSVAAEAGGAVSGTEAEVARLDVQEAGASVQGAEADTLAATAAVDAATLDVARTRVLAPFDGVVRELQAIRGQRVGAGTPLVTVLGRGDLEVIVDLPRAGAGEGQEATLGTAPNTVQGTVRGVVPGLSSARTQRVRVVIPSPPDWLLPGSVLPARVVIGHADDAISVPRDALTGGAVFVAIVAPSQIAGASPNAPSAGLDTTSRTARRVPVTERWDGGDEVVVEGDLKAGDEVVVRGNEALSDGATITIGAPGP